MSLWSAENLYFAYGADAVVEPVSLRIEAGDRIGLVGPNGEGKSTLLKLIAGDLAPTSGKVTRARGATVGLLPQDPPAPADVTLYESLREVFAEQHELQQQMQATSESIAKHDDDPDILGRYDELHQRFEAGGGYDYLHRIDAVYEGLGFDASLRDRPLRELSGGQRTRGYLGRLLLRQPDLLLLDEPTNHLDIEATQWLEEQLARYRGAMVVVSHDRWFLDKTTRATWEIGFGRVETYRGGYSEYLPKRRERFEQRLAQWQSQQEHVARTREFIDRNLAGQRSKEAQGRRKRLERFLRDEAIDRPRELREMHLPLEARRSGGRAVLRVEGLRAGYHPDQPLVGIERLEVARGARVAIVGPNGCGKTTLLRTLLGLLPPLAGEVKWGANTDPGYLSQTHENLQGELDAVANLRKRTALGDDVIRDALGALLLSDEQVFQRVDQLSGGQRSRAALAGLALERPNVLLLDEPTNHLDIPSTEVLQRSIREYDGTVVMVSHDRRLIQQAATEIWALLDGRVHVIPGAWEDYLRWRARQTSAAADTPEAQDKRQRKDAYRRARRQANELQRLRRRQHDTEERVHDLEARLERKHDEISAAGEAGDVERVARLGEEYQRLEEQLAESMRQWEHLGEQIEALSGEM